MHLRSVRTGHGAGTRSASRSDEAAGHGWSRERAWTNRSGSAHGRRSGTQRRQRLDLRGVLRQQPHEARSVVDRRRLRRRTRGRSDQDGKEFAGRAVVRERPIWRIRPCRVCMHPIAASAGCVRRGCARVATCMRGARALADGGRRDASERAAVLCAAVRSVGRDLVQQPAACRSHEKEQQDDDGGASTHHCVEG